jgi:hypothetical protein
MVKHGTKAQTGTGMIEMCSRFLFKSVVQQARAAGGNVMSSSGGDGYSAKPYEIAMDE